MNNFFRTHYSQEDLQQRLAQRRGRKASTSGMLIGHQAPLQSSEETIDMAGMMGGDTLDDIIMANNKEMQRRQSYPHGFANQDLDRRSSMMEFGSGNDGLDGYQFGEPAAGPVDPNLRRQSTGELEMADEFSDLGPAMNMAGQPVPYSSPVQGHNPLFINTTSPFQGMSADMMQNMMNTPINMAGMVEDDHNSLSMFSSTFSQAYSGGSLDQMPSDFMMSSNIQNSLQTHTACTQGGCDSKNMVSRIPDLASEGKIVSSSQPVAVSQSLGPYNSPVTTNLSQPISSQDPQYTMDPTQPVPELGRELESVSNPVPKSTYQGIYSQSGFDMLGALMKVATRKNPEIDIGKVDMSCAFVVCDISLHDCPIIYVSDIFERLTGYNKHEVKGQNCRFLQSPEGKVEAGARREFVDNDSVYYLRNRIAERKEAQRSLINYRKGGQPFMNLLTMIPITGEDDETIKYYVGFQVDLVEKPTSVEGKSASGLYTVDYSQGMLPRYVWQPPEGIRPSLDGGQTISRDDVSTVLSSINTGTESELTKRMWDKILLENTDDVVHVLSLKGLFLYLSPSSRHVLEYDASELVGTALSSVCHPSDIVPVTRELKDTSTGAAVNIVFRIRRKKSGYTWFESHGSLCVEQGKGRKCIILVGRERPVYALHRHEIEAAGGIGESEVWTKLSTSGMFLFVSSNIRTLLDRSSDDLIGTSIQGLMRAESKVEFGRSLEKARTGKRVIHKHEVLNKRGLVLQAQTTLYPGDASEGQKPTFLVGQTRLLKTSSRNVVPAGSKLTSGMGRLDQQPEESTILTHPSILSNGIGPESPTTRLNTSLPGPITQAGSSGLAIGSQDVALASEDNIFDELKTTRCTSWQFELRQMEKSNRLLAEELAALLSNKKKRKRRKGAGHLQRDCANCHTRVTPEWRRGPSGQRDLCNSCGLRWAKQTGRVSPRTSTKGDKQSQHSASPQHSSHLQQEFSQSNAPPSSNPNVNNNERNSRNVKNNARSVLVGRTTSESIPVHKLSKGFREGGERGIVVIEEESPATGDG